MNKNLGLAAILGVATVALASACGSAEQTSNTEGDEARVGSTTAGLSIVEMDEAAGKLVIKFEKDGRAITYDMRLGPKMAYPPSAEELAKNPELPSYEVDAQVVDAKNQPFQLRMGGDGFIDASWTMPHVEAIDEIGRARDIHLMAEAVAAFRQLKLPEGLEQLRLTGIDLGLGVESTPEKPGMTSPESAGGTPTPGTRLKVNVVQGPSSVTKWDFLVRKKSVSLIGIPLADHSAVHLRGWSSSGVVFNAESCNHGTCARSSAMTTHCVMPGFRSDNGTHSRFFYTEGCKTPYAWNSGPGRHNCNDDSLLQTRAIYYDSWQSTTTGLCSAAGANYRAPGCSPSPS